MPNNIDAIFPIIYEDLKRIARIQRNKNYSKKNLGTRSIVHEAYLNIINNNSEIDNKEELLYLTSVTMQNIIIDNARAWQAQKRGGNHEDVPIEQLSLVSVQKNTEILALDEALTNLKKENKRMADIVTCRFFGGLTQEETSKALKLSTATIKRDWTLAKAILFQNLVL
jgi:RNA polymerase sigma factor (TIGR02999 family)